MTIDIDYLSGWIGRESFANELLTAASVQRFNAVFDRSSCLDEGAEAPILMHLCLAQPADRNSVLGNDGQSALGGFLPPVPLPRRVWTSSEITFHDAIRIGDIVTRHTVIDDLKVSQCRTGVLCSVTLLHRLVSADRNALTERQDIVYQMPEVALAKAGAPAPSVAPKGEFFRTLLPSTPLLFRYSAITFNSHRIHYDRRYACNEENYPGLVVHSSLQATLLVQFASDLRKAPPARFKFQSIAPIFDTSEFTINANNDGPALKLWTAATGGPLAVEARAEW